MVGINSSYSNASIVTSLRQINKDLATTQTRIGTGLKVNSASDNAAIFTLAQGIRSDIKSQDTLATGITTVKATADTAIAAMDKISELLGKIKEVADGATTTTATAADVNKVTAYQKQIASLVASAGFQKSNFLNTASPAETKTTISFDKGVAVTLDVQTIDLTNNADYKAAAVTAVTLANISGLSANVDKALTAISSYTATLSAYSDSLSSQSDFLAALKSIKENAVSSLVDANLEEESAKVTALQVKQQLAYQALAIGNSSSQNILALFR
jgi:flagellin